MFTQIRSKAWTNTTTKRFISKSIGTNYIVIAY